MQHSDCLAAKKSKLTSSRFPLGFSSVPFEPNTASQTGLFFGGTFSASFVLARVLAVVGILPIVVRGIESRLMLRGLNIVVSTASNFRAR